MPKLPVKQLSGSSSGGGMSVPFWDNFCDSPAFYATARPDAVKEYYKKVIKNQWYEVKMV
jgi:hypothetical protein